MKNNKKYLMIFLCSIIGISIVSTTYFICFKMGIFNNKSNQATNEIDKLSQYVFTDDEEAMIVKNNRYIDVQTLLYCLIKNTDLPNDVKVTKNDVLYPTEIKISFYHKKNYEWVYRLE